MQLFIKATTAAAIMFATPAAGFFNLAGTQAAMVNAGFSTLCGNAAVSLLENDGNPAKAMEALEKNGLGNNIARSVATAGLFGGGGTLPGNAVFMDYLKKAVIQLAVNTALSVAIDKQDFKQAMLQGMTSAAINSVASWGAGQIGELYSKEAVNYAIHKALHGIVAAGLGAGMAAISHTDPRLGAASGAFGAVMAEMIAEGFKPEMADVEAYARKHPGTKPENVQRYFMERAQATANWAAFASAVGAFRLGMDVSTAHGSARNAVDNNSWPHFLMACVAASVEYYHFLQDLKTDQVKVALGKLGIRIAQGAALCMGVSCAFEVGGVICKTLPEALALVRSSPLFTKEMEQTCLMFERNVPQVEKMVMDLSSNKAQAQFNQAAPKVKREVRFADGGAKSVWQKGPVVRGEEIEKKLGQNLHQNFPVIDKFDSGIATSIKSLDLNAITYQNPTTLRRIISNYVDTLSKFDGATLVNDVVLSSQIRGRALDLAIPSCSTPVQRVILDEMKVYASNQGVKLNIIVTK